MHPYIASCMFGTERPRPEVIQSEKFHAEKARRSRQEFYRSVVTLTSSLVAKVGRVSASFFRVRGPANRHQEPSAPTLIPPADTEVSIVDTDAPLALEPVSDGSSASERSEAVAETDGITGRVGEDRIAATLDASLAGQTDDDVSRVDQKKRG